MCPLRQDCCVLHLNLQPHLQAISKAVLCVCEEGECLIIRTFTQSTVHCVKTHTPTHTHTGNLPLSLSLSVTHMHTQAPSV